jgi:hypothetical protein
MKTDTKSHNTRSDIALKELLIPSAAQIWLDFTIAVVLLALLNIRGLWAYFAHGILDASQSDVSDIINQKGQGVHNFLDTISKGRFLQIVFWLFVGCVVYMLIWFVRSFFTNIRNDIVADEYMHPFTYNRNTYWQSVIARKLFFVSILVIFIGFTITGFKLALVLAGLTYSSIEAHDSAHSVVQVLGSIIVTALLIQIFVILLRLLSRSWKLIYTDL